MTIQNVFLDHYKALIMLHNALRIWVQVKLCNTQSRLGHGDRVKMNFFYKLCLQFFTNSIMLNLNVYAVKSDLLFEFGVLSLRHLDSYFWQVTGYRNN